MNPCANLLGAILVAVVGICPVSAHGIGAEVKRAGDRLTVEAFFDDDAPAADARVTLFDASQNVWAEGMTDAAGRWSCATPPAGNYRVIVEAPGGHRTFKALTVGGDATKEGPTRAEFTGPAKWGRAAGGVLALMLALYVWMRSRGIGDPKVRPPEEPGSNPPTNSGFRGVSGTPRAGAYPARQANFRRPAA